MDAAAVAPDGSAALAVRSGKLIWYAGLRSGMIAGATVAGAIPGIDRFAWAPDGSSAAVYASGTGQAQIVSHGVAGAAIDLTTLPAPLTALAFDGQRLLAGFQGGVFSVDSQGSAQRIAAAGVPSAITLAGADLYLADAQSQEIWQVQGYAGAATALLFAKGAGPVVGLQLSADGRRLLAAEAGRRQLIIYDVAARTPARTLPLDSDPAGLDRFGDPTVFLLNGSASPLYVLSDRGVERSAVYFVPLPPVETWRQALRRRAN